MSDFDWKDTFAELKKPWRQATFLTAEGIAVAFALLAPAIGGAALWPLLAVALGAGRHAYRRFTVLADTPMIPMSRIASTAQGYAGLTGRGALLEGRPRVFEPSTGQPCLWYRASYSRVSGNRKVSVSDSDESDASFLLDDGGGAALAVDPEGAEMLVRRETHYRQNFLIRQQCLRPGDRIWVFGDFATMGSIDTDLDTRRQTGELLELWKADRPDLLRRFDLDGDGELSLEEWALARAAARREVLATQRQALAAPEAYVMHQPRDGLYLIADREPRALALAFRFWAAVHGLIFIAAAGALAYVYAAPARLAGA